MLIRIFEMPEELRTDRSKEWIRRGFTWSNLQESMRVSFSPTPAALGAPIRILITGISLEDHRFLRLYTGVVGTACTYLIFEAKLPHRGFEYPRVALPKGVRPL